MEHKARHKRPARTIIFWTFVLSICYAILRYHIAGPVPWKDLPFFILNKGIALSAFLLLTFNFTFSPLKNLGVSIPDSWLAGRRTVGIIGFLLSFIHVIMSFMLFKPSVYPKFFEQDSTMTLVTGLSMLGGVLSFIFLWIYNISFNSELKKDRRLMRLITSRRMMLFVMFLAGTHIFFMGFKGWAKTGDWYGGLPPISLVAFSFAVVGYVINLFGREDPVI